MAGNTDVVPYDLGAYASRTTFLSGGATQRRGLLRPESSCLCWRQTRYAIGDTVSYRIRIGIPATGVFNSGPHPGYFRSGLTYRDRTLTVIYPLGGHLNRPIPQSHPHRQQSPFRRRNTQSRISGTLTNSTSRNQTITLTYQAQVDNILTNQDNQTLLNDAAMTFTDPGTGNPGLRTASTLVTVASLISR